VPAQRKPDEDEDEAAGTDEPAEPPSTPADPARTAVDPAPGPLPGGPADATTPARPHPVRAIARVAAPAFGTDAGSRRRRLAAVAIAVILVLAGAVWVIVRDSDVGGSGNRQTGDPGAHATPTQPAQTAEPTAGATDPPTEPVTTPPTPGGDATGAPGGERPVLPAGWRDYTDQTGFSLYVPANWRVSREGRMVYFRGDGRVLGIDQTDQPRPDPVADWRGQAATRVGRGDFPNYNEIRIEAVPFWQKAADWEFTYGTNGRRTHVNNRGFVVSSHKAYGIWWQAPDAEWADANADLQLIFASFRPAPAALN
jgi:hypothetical protein